LREEIKVLKNRRGVYYNHRNLWEILEKGGGTPYEKGYESLGEKCEREKRGGV